MIGASSGRPRARGRGLSTWVQRQLERLTPGVRRIAGSTGWQMVGHAARMAAGLLVGVYVARYLGPDSFGVLNYAISFAFLFSALAGLGASQIVVRDLVARPEGQEETLGSTFALQVVGSTLVLALVAVVAWATQPDATTRSMIVVVAAGLCIQKISAPAEWFRSKVLARPVVVAGLIGMGVASALRVAFILLGKPVEWFAWPFLVEAALTAVLVLAFYRRHESPSLGEWRPRMPRMGELLADSWPLALSAGLVVLQQRVDQVMLGEILGSTEVGWYAAAVRLSQLWHVVPFVIATAVFPAIVRAREHSPELYQRRMQAFFDLMLWLAVAIALPSTLVAAPVVGLLFGDAYGPSAGILQVHIWTLVVASLGTAAGRWLIVEGLTRVTLAFSAASMLLNVLVNLLLIPHFGALGAAWATLVASASALLLFLIYRPARPAGFLMLKALGAWIRPIM